mmetsp:Transcript_888/g.2609  ORF Transcript_888/g.2609 Transcript_888/m.2609 type:complete len:536 (+) Transcript_888:287-1894(+)
MAASSLSLSPSTERGREKEGGLRSWRRRRVWRGGGRGCRGRALPAFLVAKEVEGEFGGGGVGDSGGGVGGEGERVWLFVALGVFEFTEGGEGGAAEGAPEEGDGVVDEREEVGAGDGGVPGEGEDGEGLEEFEASRGPEELVAEDEVPGLREGDEFLGVVGEEGVPEEVEVGVVGIGGPGDAPGVGAVSGDDGEAVGVVLPESAARVVGGSFEGVRLDALLGEGRAEVGAVGLELGVGEGVGLGDDGDDGELGLEVLEEEAVDLEKAVGGDEVDAGVDELVRVSAFGPVANGALVLASPAPGDERRDGPHRVSVIDAVPEPRRVDDGHAEHGVRLLVQSLEDAARVDVARRSRLPLARGRSRRVLRPGLEERVDRRRLPEAGEPRDHEIEVEDAGLQRERLGRLLLLRLAVSLLVRPAQRRPQRLRHARPEIWLLLALRRRVPRHVPRHVLHRRVRLRLCCRGRPTAARATAAAAAAAARRGARGTARPHRLVRLLPRRRGGRLRGPPPPLPEPDHQALTPQIQPGHHHERQATP